MMRGEIDSGTQAASLEQVRRCVGGDLKDGKLASLRENLVLAKLLLGEGRGISPPDMEAAREEIARKIALVDSIKAKLQLGVNQVSDEIDRQRSRPIPRIG